MTVVAAEFNDKKALWELKPKLHLKPGDWFHPQAKEYAKSNAKGLTSADINKAIKKTREDLHREYGSQLNTEVKVSKEAAEELRKATEEVLTELFHRSVLLAEHAKRKTTTVPDVRLAALLGDPARFKDCLLYTSPSPRDA